MPEFPVIAVVDDDPSVRGSIDSLLRSAMLAPRCFSRAEDLLASALGGDLACVVSDLHMPGMTGLELQTEMGKRGWKMPFILMTAYPTETARDQAMRAGAVCFLTKPVDPDLLLGAIMKAAERSAD